MLGPGSEDAAQVGACRAYPNGLQLGGGVTPDNAAAWLECRGKPCHRHVVFV